jgi:hypothetical protein
MADIFQEPVLIPLKDGSVPSDLHPKPFVKKNAGGAGSTEQNFEIQVGSPGERSEKWRLILNRMRNQNSQSAPPAIYLHD